MAGKVDWKKNAILAAIAAFGGGLVTQFGGEWLAKIPMADKEFFGVTVLGFAAIFVAFVVADLLNIGK